MDSDQRQVPDQFHTLSNFHADGIDYGAGTSHSDHALGFAKLEALAGKGDFDKRSMIGKGGSSWLLGSHVNSNGSSGSPPDTSIAAADWAGATLFLDSADDQSQSAAEASLGNESTRAVHWSPEGMTEQKTAIAHSDSKSSSSTVRSVFMLQWLKLLLIFFFSLLFAVSLVHCLTNLDDSSLFCRKFQGPLSTTSTVQFSTVILPADPGR